MINLKYSIIKYPNKKLFLKSNNITNFNNELCNNINDMKNIMIHNNGIGLAAIQIGILKNICLIVEEETKKILEFINPIILKKKGSTSDIEGCLSIPNRYDYISRPSEITVQAYNKYGKLFKKNFFNLNARILCHEIDHLNGILFIQHINTTIIPKIES